MTSHLKTIHLTPEEYFSIERRNEYKSEYVTSEKVTLPPGDLKEGELL